MRAMSLSPPPLVTAASPCTGHCTTVLGDDVCRTCLRTFEEVTRWVAMTDDERCDVNQRIAKLKSTPSNSPLSGGERMLSSPDKGRMGEV
jgi:predicted Fe-S protein YdhL (DUF1289 family)